VIEADNPAVTEKDTLPVVVVSACLLRANCRWDGDVKIYKDIDEIFGGAWIIPVCPEVSIGLGVPRPPIRLVSDCAGIRLLRPSDGRDLTETVREFAGRFIKSLPKNPCFVLKSRSPSCAIIDADVFPSIDSEFPAGRSHGIFTGEILRRLPSAVMTDEKRLESVMKPLPLQKVSSGPTPRS